MYGDDKKGFELIYKMNDNMDIVVALKNQEKLIFEMYLLKWDEEYSQMRMINIEIDENEQKLMQKKLDKKEIDQDAFNQFIENYQEE